MVNWPAIGFTILPNVGGLAGGLITRAAIEKWYDQLKKPNWRPPNWAFGPIWTSLYCGMGYASYLVWKEGDWHQEPVRTALAVYGINLVANWSWTPIFFGAKDIQLALYEIQIINVTAAATAYLFYKINPYAGLLILPYCAWLGLATALNYVIWRDNKDIKIKEIKDN
ncbi:unnamed protein product [Callosobruchus maculatus]|uniref:TspO/MBR-related protein n=1 Tax=Callosobruchus maculatus TaxID=64391 RepID=A0A653CTU0_CALMS|nr:unnamed protein product [Callosobruchus maculatus]